MQDDLVRLPLAAADKWRAIEELVDVLEAILTRERSMSTALGQGIAVPHGAVDRVRDVVAALGISPAGIPFQAADGKPVHIVVLLVIPRGSFQQHVSTLA